MPNQHTHIIQKQHLRLGLESERNAFKQQSAFREAYYEKVLPAIEAVLDRYSRDGVTIRIDQLHLDLGELSMEEVETDFAEKAAKALSEQLSLLIPKAEMGVVKGVEIKQKGQSEAEMLIRFLKTGTLPWWAGQQDRFNPRSALQSALDHRPRELVSSLLRELPNELIVKRLARQFAPELVLRLVEATATPVSGMARPVMEGLMALRQLPSTAFSWTLDQVAEFMLRQAFSEARSGKRPSASVAELEVLVAEFSRPFFTYLAQKTGKTAARLVEEIRRAFKASSPGGLPANLKLLGLVLDSATSSAGSNRPRKNNNVTESLSPSQQSPEREENQAPTKRAADSPEAKQESQTPPQTPPDERERPKGPPWKLEDSEYIYIENAGLVLLGGFLEHFFQNLGYLNEDKHFRDLESQARAVYLLEYLASGKALLLPEEEDLFLNKLLCGFPLSEALPPPSSPLTEAEIAEAETLLRTVIDYWKALGSIAPNDLRATFFRREGKLIQKDSHWDLKVDRQTVDVLLEKIPWTYGRVMQSWMEYHIVVDW